MGVVTQQEIVSLYSRFCQLDRNAKGFISADEFLSVPEFAMNPLSHVGSIELLIVILMRFFNHFCLELWISDFYFYLFVLVSALKRLLKMVDGLNFKDFVAFLSAFSAKATVPQKIESESYNFLSIV